MEFAWVLRFISRVRDWWHGRKQGIITDQQARIDLRDDEIASLTRKLEESTRKTMQVTQERDDLKSRVENLETELAKIRQPSGLTEDLDRVLSMLFRWGKTFRVEHVASFGNVDPSVARHYMDELSNYGLIRQAVAAMGPNDAGEWELTAKARARVVATLGKGDRAKNQRD